LQRRDARVKPAFAGRTRPARRRHADKRTHPSKEFPFPLLADARAAAARNAVSP
jgi:hypothetical protein